MALFLPLENVIRRAPLGLRFLDLVRGTPVTDGLVVTAWRVGDTRGTVAERSPLSGIYGYRSLPGLRPYEVGEQPALDWCASPPNIGLPTVEDLLDLASLRFLVQADAGISAANFTLFVEDRLERFLPQTLLMCLPKERLVEVPLFSAPARPTLTGLAAIRGELWNRTGGVAGSGGSAGWAVVTVTTDDDATYTAIADARGMFSLYMPYASALPPLSGSPPRGAAPLDQLSWPLTVRVFYQPSTLRRVAGLVPPDTRSILEQAAAVLYTALNADVPDESGATLTRSLQFGLELVLTTRGRDALGQPHSRLILDPAL